MQLKKTPFRIGGHNYIIESEGVSADRFYMVDSFIRRQADRADGLSIVQCLHIFGVSRSGYYSWVRRKKEYRQLLCRKERTTGAIERKV